MSNLKFLLNKTNNNNLDLIALWISSIREFKDSSANDILVCLSEKKKVILDWIL